MRLIAKLLLAAVAAALVASAAFLAVIWGLNVLASRDDWRPV